MKKLISLLLCLLLSAAAAAPALGDVIWEPEDDFYMSHYDECTQVGAVYEAQTDAVIRKSPDRSASVGTIAAGDEVYVYYSWNGWGYVELRDDGWTDGWVDLGGFRRLYNSDDFVLEHQDEIVQEGGTVERAEHAEIRLWTFPGSGEISDIIDSSFDWAEADPEYYSVWTDGDGRQWGHVGYYYGMRGWIYLDDPSADGLPVSGPRYSGEEPVPAAAASPSFPTLAVTLVAAVVLVTAAVILLTLRKRKTSNGSE